PHQPVHLAPDSLRAGDVAGVVGNRYASQLRCQNLQGPRMQVQQQHELRLAAGKAAGQGGADTTAGAGDDDGVVVQFQFCSPLCSPGGPGSYTILPSPAKTARRRSLRERTAVAPNRLWPHRPTPFARGPGSYTILPSPGKTARRRSLRQRTPVAPNRLWAYRPTPLASTSSRVRRHRLIPLTEPYIRATYTAHAIRLPRTRGQ